MDLRLTLIISMTPPKLTHNVKRGKRWLTPPETFIKTFKNKISIKLQMSKSVHTALKLLCEKTSHVFFCPYVSMDGHKPYYQYDITYMVHI